MYRQCPEGIAGVATAIARDGQDTEAFTRVLRMDGAIERSIGLTIRLLQKLQTERGKKTGLTSTGCETACIVSTSTSSTVNIDSGAKEAEPAPAASSMSVDPQSSRTP
jgi:hypothetical protein